MAKSTTSDTWTLPVTSERVFAVALSATTPAVLAIGTRSSVSVLQLTFPEESTTTAAPSDSRTVNNNSKNNEDAVAGGSGGFDATLIREINHDGRVHSLAWPIYASAPHCAPPSTLSKRMCLIL